MTRIEFDKWISTRLPVIRRDILRKYPRVTDIDADIADFYLHAIERLHLIKCPSSYLYSWVYNRNYRYTRKDRKIIYMDVLPDIADDTEYDMLGDRVLDIVDTLALPEKILWDLYYVQGLTTRKIAKMHNLSHTGVAKQIQRLQKQITKEL